MFVLLALLFLAVPLLELYVIVRVAADVGVGNTIVALIALSVLGAWLAKRAGLGVLRSLQATVQAGRVPSREIVDGFLVLLAGALMLTPGFLTDALALALLLPPIRAAIRRTIIRSLRNRTRVFVLGGAGPHASHWNGRAAAWDVESWEADRQPPPERDDPPHMGGGRGELGP